MPQKYAVRIERINAETKDSKSYIFVPTDHDDGLFNYMPGMFFLLEAEVNRPET
ncbi:MAG: hypothetical protein HYU02_08810, partial [Thaumarchaeota archaeon]|nr:hypothetical protein [Nitrososphaerota archaeon]